MSDRSFIHYDLTRTECMTVSALVDTLMSRGFVPARVFLGSAKFVDAALARRDGVPVMSICRAKGWSMSPFGMAVVLDPEIDILPWGLGRPLNAAKTVTEQEDRARGNSPAFCDPRFFEDRTSDGFSLTSPVSDNLRAAGDPWFPYWYARLARCFGALMGRAHDGITVNGVASDGPTRIRLVTQRFVATPSLQETLEAAERLGGVDAILATALAALVG